MPGDQSGNRDGAEELGAVADERQVFVASQYCPATASTRRILRVLVTCAQEGRPGISSTELAERALISWSGTKSQLRRLIHAGIVCRSGRARASRYWLVEDAEGPGMGS